MESIKELQALLLAEQSHPFLTAAKENSQRIVVLKHYRFHKQLSIELYDAPVTTAGKLKNPLTPVNPLDSVLSAMEPATMQFYASIARFQNNPTAARAPEDIIALKTIIKNPQGYRFFYHDPGFSEKVVAGSLVEVKAGAILHNLTLLVNKQDAYYELTPQLYINDKVYTVGQLDVRYDYFILVDGLLHLAANLSMVKVLQYFNTRPMLRVHESKFREFREQVLTPLENQVEVVYTHINAATDAQLEANGLKGAMERIIYLSEMAQYVLITPVMRYGATEVPVMSKRTVHASDERGNVFALSRNADAEAAFTALLMQQHPHFYEQLENDLTYFYLHRDRFLDEQWFLHAFEQWQDAGITIFGFNQIKGNKLNANKASISIQVLSGHNWFNADVQVRFGKKRAALKQLQQAVRNKNRFVQLDDGTLGILPEQWIERLAAFFEAGEIVEEELQVPKYQFATIAELFTEAELDDEVKKEVQLFRERLSNPAKLEPVQPPAGLEAHLRHYQLEGLSWLNFLDQQGLGGCLADDMGLGKTLQVIAFMLLLKDKQPEQAPHLVVMPTSLLFNWQAEIRKFAPTLKVHLLYGADRKRDTRLFADFDVVLTTYGVLLSDISYLRHYPFHYVFLDESQQIKNIGSQRYHAARLLRAHNRIVVTGTPVENNTLDLYAQLSFACPGLLGNRKSFKDLFSIPIDRFQSSRHAKELQQKVAPFILRRTKADVAPELPDKSEVILYCPMEPDQRKVYDAYEKELRDYLEGKTQDEVLRNAIHVLRGLTQLRQICDAPSLLQAESLQGEGSAKLNTLMEQIELRTPAHKILVFSQFVSMLELVRKELDQTGIGYAYLTGSTRDREAEVKRFQEDSGTRVFLLSLKAGGTGLNLTAADYVYLVDPWWNPAVENQAIDRAYRIGQHKNVMAIRLICPDTVEEKMMQLQATKRALSGELIRNEQDFFQNITAAEWSGLVGARP